MASTMCGTKASVPMRNDGIGAVGASHAPRQFSELTDGCAVDHWARALRDLPFLIPLCGTLVFATQQDASSSRPSIEDVV
jgi:hypothetical protein